MKSLQSHSNPILKSMALKFLTGVSEQMQPSIQTADMPNDLSAEIQALKQTAAEPLTEQVSPNVPTNVSVASGTSELFDFQAGNNVIQSSDRSARVDARQSLIGLHSESGNSSAHMAAVMNQERFSSWICRLKWYSNVGYDAVCCCNNSECGYKSIYSK